MVKVPSMLAEETLMPIAPMPIAEREAAQLANTVTKAKEKRHQLQSYPELKPTQG